MLNDEDYGDFSPDGCPQCWCCGRYLPDVDDDGQCDRCREYDEEQASAKEKKKRTSR